ncbi:DNA primase large subunit [Linderina pennispora]|uniref:DNA primase large subunit n=1 Tax=Linderina pennispora TaxID=61395 RepID=A0A1Y1WI34_9FUNG|nr:DNA primase large subunit [Linderina pennispora]ORX72886.1 DNA primase large subunit [Linderina pennispora]
MFSQKAIKRGISGDTQATPEVVRHSRYPHRLSVYSDPPELEVSIEEFESFALDRLQVLKAIEDAQIRSSNEADRHTRISSAVDAHLPLHTNRSKLPLRQLMAERRKDHVSHFILRLAFSRTEDLQSWFLRHEGLLLQHRFRDADAQEKQHVLATMHLPLVYLAPGEGMDVRGSYYSKQDALFEVDFEHVLDLVQRMQVVVNKGRALVPQAEIATLLVHEFRRQLSRALAVCAKALPQLGEDERLVPVLQSLSRQSVRSEYQPTGAAGEVTADSVDSLAVHFPLCMRHLHTSLLKDHHLRHGGRMQLGLFLKGIGLGLPEALVYWRRAFSNLTDDQFQKGYAYNIRHNYGQEGRRVNYTPYSCNRIITTNPPGPGDHHGCPFRHFASDRLNAALRQDGLGEAEATEVVELARNGHYQVACTRHMEINLRKRRTEPAEELRVDTVVSPNQWFDLSVGNGKLPESSRFAASAAQPPGMTQ